MSAQPEPLHDEDGTITGAIAVTMDVTQERRLLQDLVASREALRDSEERYRTVIEASLDGIVVYGLDDRVRFANKRMALMLGYDRPDQLIGRSAFEHIVPEQQERARRDLQGLLQRTRVRAAEYDVVRVDGVRFTVESSVALLSDNGGEIGAVMAVVRDVSERNASQAALRASEEKATTILESITDALFTMDISWCLTYVNHRAEFLLRKTNEELLGNVLWDLFPGTMGTQFDEEFHRALDTGRPAKFEAYFEPVETWFEVTAYPSTTGLSVYFQDITQRVQMEGQLRHQALYDSLTDLPNRTLLNDRLEHAIRTTVRTSGHLSLLFIDVDRFKEINDSFGHHIGDILLQQIGPRLSGVLRNSDTVARLGGDEFAIVLPDTDTAGTRLTAKKILHAFDAPFECDGHILAVEVSLGIALCPDHASESSTLFQLADIAMYAAKNSGSGFAFFAKGQTDEHAPARLGLLGDLRQALERGEFELYYQPKVQLGTNKTIDVEALIRWRHPERGLIPPGHFIPLVERTGLMRPVTMWVLHTALEQCAAWKAAGVSLDVTVAVNLSARGLHDSDLVTAIADLIAMHGIPASRLCLEITESAIMIDPVNARATVTRLHELGVRISIDDFGMGYSSLSYLSSLPVDEIKIDKSFVFGMMDNHHDEIITRSVIDMGHNLSVLVIAEGVQDQETYAKLKEMGCDMAQGFLMCRPVPPDELLAYVESVRATGAQPGG